MPTLDTMIDLETLGSTPDSVILSIAAVKFDPFDDYQDRGITPDQLPTLNILVDIDSQTDRRIDESTVAWWSCMGILCMMIVIFLAEEKAVRQPAARRRQTCQGRQQQAHFAEATAFGEDFGEATARPATARQLGIEFGMAARHRAFRQAGQGLQVAELVLKGGQRQIGGGNVLVLQGLGVHARASLLSDGSTARGMTSEGGGRNWAWEMLGMVCLLCLE